MISYCASVNGGQAYKMLEPTTGEELFLPIDEIFDDPETEWNADCVEPRCNDLVNIGLVEPSFPTQYGKRELPS